MNYKEDENNIRTIFRNEAHLSTGIVDSCNIALKYIERCKQLEKDKLKLIDRKVSNSLDQIDTPICEEIYTIVFKSGTKIEISQDFATQIIDNRKKHLQIMTYHDEGIVNFDEIAFIGNRKVS